MNLTVDQRARFWRKIHPSGSSECWGIAVRKNRHNQPQIGFAGKMVIASRVMFSLTKGPIPQGLQVLHTCDNPACVNPTHLWAGTQSDNIRDCAKKNRHSNQKLSTAQIHDIKTLGKSGVLFNELSHRFGITPQYASRVVRGIQPTYIQ